MTRSPAFPGAPRLRDRLLSAAEGAISFFLPPACPGCERKMDPSEYGFCRDCDALLETPTEPVCDVCGRSKSGTGPGGRCKECKSFPLGGFDAARGAYLYRGPLIAAIHHLKYRRHEELSEFLGRRLFLHWRERWPEALEVEAIVATPLHWRRQWKRGFNQAECLAGVAARLGDLPLLREGFQRIKPTASQARLSAGERWINVEEAFAVSCPQIYAGRRLLLVDDVMTTGATLCAAARALKQAGAQKVYALALARTE